MKWNDVVQSTCTNHRIKAIFHSMVCALDLTFLFLFTTKPQMKNTKKENEKQLK